MTVLGAIVDWGSLGQTVLASFGFGLGILLAAGLGVVASMRAQDERRAGHEGAVLAYTAATVVLIGLVAATILFEIWLIKPGNHS